MEQGSMPGNPPASDRRWWVGPDDADEPETEDRTSGRSERLVYGAETGLRWAVQSVALLLWTPLGLVFWLPLLLRRTLGYVLAVLHSGLTGSGVEGARRRWEESVGFYRVGFLRIVHAFGDGEQFPSGPRDSDRETGGSLWFEVVWSAVVWTVVLWLTGLWPDAPSAIAAAASGGWDAMTELVRDGVRRLS